MFDFDTSADSTNDASLHIRTLRDTPTQMNSGEQNLPAEAIPSDRQSPLRPPSRSQSSRAISGAGFKNSLNDSPRNISSTFEFEPQGPLLAPQSTEAMPTVDQGTLTVPKLVLVITTIAIAKLVLRVKIQFTSVIFVPLFNLTASRRNLVVQIYQNLTIYDRDYHRGIIMRKSSKTKYQLKYVVFQLRSQLLHRIS